MAQDVPTRTANEPASSSRSLTPITLVKDQAGSISTGAASVAPGAAPTSSVLSLSSFGIAAAIVIVAVGGYVGFQRLRRRPRTWLLSRSKRQMTLNPRLARVGKALGLARPELELAQKLAGMHGMKEPAAVLLCPTALRAAAAASGVWASETEAKVLHRLGRSLGIAPEERSAGKRAGVVANAAKSKASGVATAKAIGGRVVPTGTPPSRSTGTGVKPTMARAPKA
jgi:hypothetical protein